MSNSQSTPDIYRVNVSRTGERVKPRNIPMDQELYDLCNLSGVTLDSEVFQILLDLIKINVSPNALVQVLKKMTKQGTGRGSLENVAASESGRSTHSVTNSTSSRESGDTAFDSASVRSGTGSSKDDSAFVEGEKSSSERLVSRLRALRAARKAT